MEDQYTDAARASRRSHRPARRGFCRREDECGLFPWEALSSVSVIRVLLAEADAGKIALVFQNLDPKIENLGRLEPHDPMVGEAAAENLGAPAALAHALRPGLVDVIEIMGRRLLAALGRMNLDAILQEAADRVAIVPVFGRGLDHLVGRREPIVEIVTQ